MYFGDLLPRLVKAGDDGNCGSAAVCDTVCLQVFDLSLRRFFCYIPVNSSLVSMETFEVIIIIVLNILCFWCYYLYLVLNLSS